MCQIDKIKQRNPIGKQLFEDQLNPDNQKFFPFYVFTNFEVRKDDPIYCDYCGEELTGNGSFECAYFVFHQSGDIKICCSPRTCMKGVHVWDYHHQIFGQPIPLTLPEEYTPQMKLVYTFFFGENRSSSFKVMKYKKIESWHQLKKVIDTSIGGGTYQKDIKFYAWSGSKLTAYNFSNNYKHDVKISLSKPEIINVVNDLLVSMRFVQLKLF